MQAAVPTVVVPRVVPRQEQLIRARAFADLGLLQCVEPASIGDLGEAVRRALTVDRRDVARAVAAALDLDGARRAAVHLLALGAADVLADHETDGDVLLPQEEDRVAV